MAGNKEIKELMVGVNELAILTINRLKDGVQFADAEAFYQAFINDADFKAKIVAAYEDIKLAPAELKDLDWVEGSELVIMQMAYVPKIIEAFKK